MKRKMIVSLVFAVALADVALVLTHVHACTLESTPSVMATASPSPSPSETYSSVPDRYGMAYYDTTPDDKYGAYVGEQQSDVPFAGQGFAEAGYNSTNGAYVETAGSGPYSGAGQAGTQTGQSLCNHP